MSDAAGSRLGTVAAIETRRLTRPLRPPWEPGVESFHVVVVTVRTSEGLSGTGFAWTVGTGAAAIEAVIRNDMPPLVIGQPALADTIWPRMWKRREALGPADSVVLAIAALDLSLWDLRGQADTASITNIIGPRHTSVPVYRSGINLFMAPGDIVKQAARWAAEGATAVKVKVGRPELGDDIEVVRRVRQEIGPECHLMVDANQRWEIEQAIRAVDSLAEFDLTWVEEPLADTNEYPLEVLRQACDVPIAAGESLYSVKAFERLCRAGTVDVLQPNVVRVGGITPFLRVSQLCEDADRTLIPHLLPELSAQLALTLPRATMVELADGYTLADLDLLEHPIPVCRSGECLTGTGLPGLGLNFRDV